MSAIHRWIYSLIYPALLGTLLVKLIDGPPNICGDAGPTLPAWQWVVVAYLIAQYGEGCKDHRSYQWIDALADVAEMLLMVRIFVILGYFLGDGHGCADPWDHRTEARLLIAGMFAVPVVVRLIRKLRGQLPAGHCGFYWSLSLMSLAAAACGLMVELPAAMAFASLLLAMYMLLFIVAPEPLAKRHPCFRRPAARVERAARRAAARRPD